VGYLRKSEATHTNLLSDQIRLESVRGRVCLYSPSFREGLFPETGLPASVILGTSTIVELACWN
jgi:hypothetical protein